MQTNTIKAKKESGELVRDFFDEHAEAYRSKYELDDEFYNYFFFERLDKATAKISTTGKRILDIGAGTGPLYDFFVEEGMNDFKKYDATDISSGMLESSRIPEKNRHVGNFTEMTFDDKYDLIFMLGVSTYLSVDQMKSYIMKVRELLSDDGLFVVTFTNDKSLDIRMRKILSPLVRLFSGKDKIISQEFSTKYYSRKEIKTLFKNSLVVHSIEGLNHTIFPFSRIFKKLSISLAKKLGKLDEGRFKHTLSSDLLIKLSRQK